MDIKELSGNSLSYLGDDVFTLKVREYFLNNHYQNPKSLQALTSNYNSAIGQRKIYERLLNDNFFNEKELEIFKRGRNDINHIPKNSDLISYEIASGLEAICGYLYLEDQDRLQAFFNEVFKGGINNE